MSTCVMGNGKTNVKAGNQTTVNNMQHLPSLLNTPRIYVDQRKGNSFKVTITESAIQELKQHAEFSINRTKNSLRFSTQRPWVVDTKLLLRFYNIVHNHGLLLLLSYPSWKEGRKGAASVLSIKSELISCKYQRKENSFKVTITESAIQELKQHAEFSINRTKNSLRFSTQRPWVVDTKLLLRFYNIVHDHGLLLLLSYPSWKEGRKGAASVLSIKSELISCKYQRKENSFKVTITESAIQELKQHAEFSINRTKNSLRFSTQRPWVVDTKLLREEPVASNKVNGTARLIRHDSHGSSHDWPSPSDTPSTAFLGAPRNYTTSSDSRSHYASINNGKTRVF
ncbi:hypothetical protein CDAR_50411 [Caerostris darwini]|uniref:Uncharacterized protein n=1 Tax=Caerostris darwini TaxID=1538125 RepID=A0AAV4UWG1_9ARAC|nr:hypothetical protein CDAR_50411 [Caerostris darwini]